MEKFQTIKNYINSIISIKDADWELLCEHISIKTVRKNELLLKEGQICDFIAFVGKGALIYFKVLKNGNAVTIDFVFENDWVTNNHSRLNNSPSYLTIKALEDSELFIIKHTDLSFLYGKIPQLERLSRLLIEQAYVKLVQLNIDLQTLSATDRYLKLLEEHPDIPNKIPLYHIANYLGIAPKSLSRIRNSIFSPEK